MARLIKQDSSYTEILAKQDGFTLEELQGYVGGYIERVQINSPSIVYVDEEGRLKGKPVNVLASALTGIELVGDVLICKQSEVK